MAPAPQFPPRYRRAGPVRKVIDEEGLTAKQRMVLSAAMTVGLKRNFTLVAREAGVTPTTISKWVKHDPVFSAAWTGLFGDALKVHLPAVVAALLAKAEQGDVAACRLVLDASGLMQSRVLIEGRVEHEVTVSTSAYDEYMAAAKAALPALIEMSAQSLGTGQVDGQGSGQGQGGQSNVAHAPHSDADVVDAEVVEDAPMHDVGGDGDDEDGDGPGAEFVGHVVPAYRDPDDDGDDPFAPDAEIVPMSGSRRTPSPSVISDGSGLGRERPRAPGSAHGDPPSERTRGTSI